MNEGQVFQHEDMHVWTPWTKLQEDKSGTRMTFQLPLTDRLMLACMHFTIAIINVHACHSCNVYSHACQHDLASGQHQLVGSDLHRSRAQKQPGYPLFLW